MTTIPHLTRAPVVAVLGHVDHGKTSLLDAVRNTHIQASESGGITQHIGAYQVIHKGQPITFIDTPGHAAFAKMRARGAQATDLVILVVAATEGVKPQTKESIQHIKAAGVPLVVAINKIDLPGASVDLVNAQLAEAGVIVEAYGGNVVTVKTSATKNLGLDQLLDTILLVAELHGISGKPDDPLETVIIESHLEKHRGPVTSAIIKSGTLSVGDHVQSGTGTTKVRALFNQTGQNIKQAKAGEPIEILGFSDLPPVGEKLTRLGELTPVTATKPSPIKTITLSAEAKAKIAKIKAKMNLKSEEALEETLEDEEPKPRIKAIIKADTQGTLEAIQTNITEEVATIGTGVGEVTESDVLLALATGAAILAFRVHVSTSAQRLSELEKITIKTYQTIYELLEDLEKQVLKLLEPTIDEEVAGEADIIAQFIIKNERIAGCKVTSGKLETKGLVHLIRGDKITGSAVIQSLRQGPTPISLAKKGEDCGSTFKPSLDFKVGDKLQYYRVITQ